MIWILWVMSLLIFDLHNNITEHYQPRAGILVLVKKNMFLSISLFIHTNQIWSYFLKFNQTYWILTLIYYVALYIYHLTAQIMQNLKTSRHDRTNYLLYNVNMTVIHYCLVTTMLGLRHYVTIYNTTYMMTLY